jgi:hypothetical protein
MPRCEYFAPLGGCQAIAETQGAGRREARHGAHRKGMSIINWLARQSTPIGEFPAQEREEMRKKVAEEERKAKEAEQAKLDKQRALHQAMEDAKYTHYCSCAISSLLIAEPILAFSYYYFSPLDCKQKKPNERQDRST